MLPLVRLDFVLSQLSALILCSQAIRPCVLSMRRSTLPWLDFTSYGPSIQHTAGRAQLSEIA